MSFQARSFIFDGRPSEEFGLILANIGNTKQESGTVGSELDILEDRIPGRYRAIHYGTSGNEPLSFPIIMSSDTDNVYFDRDDIARIAGWLTGHQQYKKLVICQDDMQGVCYNCIITELEQVEAGDKTAGFKATVICDSPFAYRTMLDTIIECRGSLTFNYRCISNVNDYYYPDMVIETSETDILIENKTDSTVLSFTGLPEGKKVIAVCGETMVMECSDGTNLYDHWNLNISKHVFRAVKGDNRIEITGKCKITIKNVFPWNIGH